VAQNINMAIQDKYETINASHFGGTRPEIFFGEATSRTPTINSIQRLPVVIIYNMGFVPVFDSSYGGVENGTIRIEIYSTVIDAASGVTLDKITRAIKWGGSAPSARAGFDFGSFTMTGYYYVINFRRVRELSEYAGYEYQGNRVYRSTLEYKVVLGLKPS
jgi:hypothetical protein